MLLRVWDNMAKEGKCRKEAGSIEERGGEVKKPAKSRADEKRWMMDRMKKRRALDLKVHSNKADECKAEASKLEAEIRLLRCRAEGKRIEAERAMLEAEDLIRELSCLYGAVPADWRA